MLGFNQKLSNDADLIADRLRCQQQNWLNESALLKKELTTLATQKNTLLLALSMGAVTGWNDCQRKQHKLSDKPKQSSGRIQGLLPLLLRFIF